MSRPLKATALICVLCLLLSVPAMAASINPLKPKDFVYDDEVDSINDRLIWYKFPANPYALVYYSGVVFYQGKYSSDQPYFWAPTTDFVYWHTWPLGTRYNMGDVATDGIIDIRDFKKYSTLSLQTECQVKYSYSWESFADGAALLGFKANVYLYYWRADGSFLTADVYERIQNITLPELEPGEVRTSTATLFGTPIDVNIPADAAYIAPVVYASVNLPTQAMGPQVLSLSIFEDAYSLFASYNVLIEDSETLHAVNEKLGEVNDQLGDLNDKADQIIQQPEQEKQEASSGGQDAADQLVSVIPDHSEGFMTAIQDLADAMSYDGTEAKLTFPSITIPEIPGVMKKYVLSKPYPVDFGFWIQKMPVKLLTLVQVLGTLALVVYSFKELYGTLSYALTLKGGNTDG